MRDENLSRGGSGGRAGEASESRRPTESGGTVVAFRRPPARPAAVQRDRTELQGPPEPDPGPSAA